MNILGMNIDWFKFLILLIIGLIVVGPEKLPSYARKAARLIRNFQKITNVLAGEFSKALDLDDEEGGKAPDFKKDLIAIKKSLEEDVTGLKAALDIQAKVISKTMESGTREAVSSLKKSAQEISNTVNSQAVEVKATLDAESKAVAATVEAGLKDNVASQEQAAAEVPAAAEETALETAGNSPQEEQREAPAPFPSPASKAEVG